MKYERAIVEGVSMAPTLLNGDRAVVDMDVVHSELCEGDIVVAKRRKGLFVVKRILDIDEKDGTVFLVGDNASNSIDSRNYGRLPLQSIIGRVLFSWNTQTKKLKRHHHSRY